MDFGNKLKTLRTNAKLTQQQLADKMNITKSVVSYYEKHDKYPSADVLIQLAEIFNVTTDYLLGIEKSDVTYFDTQGLTEDDLKIIGDLIFHLKNKNNH